MVVLVPGFVGVAETAPYTTSFVSPGNEFSYFLSFAKLKPYLVVWAPKIFERVAKPDLLLEKLVYGPKVPKVEKPFPLIVGTRPRVVVKGKAGTRFTISGEFELFSKPVTTLGIDPKEYDAPKSHTVVAD